uniref:Uncharacterized protein n=1 Tax=Cacopsylla melanoneura TaxID=428564 RepID=A0A8D8T3Z8_9HEMI
MLPFHIIFITVTYFKHVSFSMASKSKNSSMSYGGGQCIWSTIILYYTPFFMISTSVEIFKEMGNHQFPNHSRCSVDALKFALEPSKNQRKSNVSEIGGYNVNRVYNTAPRDLLSFVFII